MTTFMSDSKSNTEPPNFEPDRVLRALTKGVDEALLQHKQAGRPIAVWRDGKTVLIPPEMIEIPDRNHQSPG